MLDKIGAMRRAKKMQDEIKKELEQIFHKEEDRDSSVLVRGDKRIEEIVIDGEERKDVKDLVNDALKQVDKKAEKKMKERAGEVMEMLGM